MDVLHGLRRTLLHRALIRCPQLPRRVRSPKKPIGGVQEHLGSATPVPSWSGFHRLPLEQRLARLAVHARLTDKELETLHAALSLDTADGLIENAAGTYAVPVGLAVGFVVDGEDVVVPMAIEESSVVAAACNGAKLAAAGGGIETEATDPVTIGQIEVRDVPDLDAAMEAVAAHASTWMDSLNAGIPRMIERGGGVVGVLARPLGGGRLVVHLHVDCRDAMGANLVNSLCEQISERVVAATGGTVGLRILSNLATQRLATARFRIPVAAVGGLEVAEGIVAANEFAVVDPYRAATHNKGIMNGIDPIVLATGNDWRAVEAGAHAYAATQDGPYRALTDYHIEEGHLIGELTMPMSLGTVGGVTALHPTARTCLKILGNPGATRLARIVVAVGLAQNLSALRALSTEGIQRGHMGLHARNLAMQAGLTGTEAMEAASRMVQEGDVSTTRARALASAYKQNTD